MVYRSKLDWVAQYVTPEVSVLDLGCVCHDLNQTAVPWLHGFLRERARRVVGVDLVESEVERMRQDGYEAVAADAQTMDLGERFDLVVAGDIIEHLDSPGALLDRARAHLAPGGTLLVTTPNPINTVRLLRVLLRGRAGANRQHTCWFTAKVLAQLAARHGLDVADEAYVDDTRLYYPWWKPSLRPVRALMRLVSMAVIWRPGILIGSLLCRLRPRLAETLCLALRPSDGV